MTVTGLVRPAAAPSVPTPACRPVVIAHRGASGYRPEHTLASYRLAIQMGADYIEPDLVSTRDGVLVARHENEISATTDVADHPELAGRRTTKVVDGRRVTGWFTEDLTLAELKTLRSRERLPRLRPANTRYDGRYEVPTFDEILLLAAEEGARRGEVVGVYPETKHPTYFAGLGLAPEEPLVQALRRHGRDHPHARVYVQSFEPASLRRLAEELRVPLVQLTAEEVSPAGLDEIATYASAVGAAKSLVIPRDGRGALSEPTGLVGDAHARGLEVHVWTLRDENQFLPTELRRRPGPKAKGDALAEAQAFLAAGVDGLFTDHTDTVVAARDEVAWSVTA